MRVKAVWEEPSGWPDRDPVVKNVEILQFIPNRNLQPGYSLRDKAAIVAIVALEDGRLDYAELMHLKVKPEPPQMVMGWDPAHEASVTGMAAYRMREDGEIERVELRD